MTTNTQTFARMFLARTLATTEDMLDRAWKHDSQATLMATIRQIARAEAHAADVHPDAADAIAYYAIETMTIEGIPLARATLEAVLANRR